MQTAVLACPSCGSKLLYRDGIRYLADGFQSQRWLCRNCGYRFTENSLNKTKSKKRVDAHGKKVLVMEVEKAEEKSGLAGATKLDRAAAKGLLLQFEFWLQKEGYAQKCRYVDCIRMLLNSGVNIYDPEDVKAAIAKKKWRNGTKMQTVYAYDALAKMLKISWEKPRYRQEEALPFIPDEKELDALICGARSKRLAAYLQTLKETFADPSEALRLEWTDIRGNVIRINKPIRNHNPREIQVSNRLISMLNSLPKTSKRIFPTSYRVISQAFYKVRRRLAREFQNPRLLKVSLTSFRHWGATMTYFQTRNILLVKQLLGHKKIENTMKYTQLIEFKDDEFEVATALTVEEAKQLLAAGFEMQPQPINGVYLFRKPKRFHR